VSKTSPTQRTLALLRDKCNMVCGITEHWNAHIRIRQDLFGFIDIVALSRELGIVAVQTTSADNASARVAKIQASEAATAWLEAGGRIWVVSWRKAGKAGTRKLWKPRIVELSFSEPKVLELTEEGA